MVFAYGGERWWCWQWRVVSLSTYRFSLFLFKLASFFSYFFLPFSSFLPLLPLQNFLVQTKPISSKKKSLFILSLSLSQTWHFLSLALLLLFLAFLPIYR